MKFLLYYLFHSLYLFSKPVGVLTSTTPQGIRSTHKGSLSTSCLSFLGGRTRGAFGIPPQQINHDDPPLYVGNKNKLLLFVRGGDSSSTSTNDDRDETKRDVSTTTPSSTLTEEEEEAKKDEEEEVPLYGRLSQTEYKLTPKQIEQFHENGCITLDNVLTQEEVDELEVVFNQFLNRQIHVPGKDFCDMSKPFHTPFEEWSIVNCMLPSTYYPSWKHNIYEQLTNHIAQQLFTKQMVKDYDQLLNKRPGKTDAIFAWHQDMGYWPTPEALAGDSNRINKDTSTVTFSLAIDDSSEANGCLRYVMGSGLSKELRPHVPLGKTRDDAHALTINLSDDDQQKIRLAPCQRGSVTLHDEYVIHGSGGNTCPDRQRRTYVIAYRSKDIVDAERRIGFTHSHNDKVNWDTFNDNASHRVGKQQQQPQQQQQQD